MNTKIKTGIAMMAIVFGLMLSPVLSNEAEATNRPSPQIIFQGDLTTPMNDKPFGGDVVGDYYMHVRDGRITISVDFDTKASPGTVYEGWLVDVDSGVKTSFGIIQENTQRQGSNLVTSIENNPDNDLIVITEEPFLDTDPAPHTPVGGAVIERSYGQ